VAIRAVALARDAIPNIELRIIGAGEEREHLVDLARSLGLSGVVTFSEGFVPVEKIPAMIADADVGVIPLRISGGTDVMLPTKLLEYVTMGIPCITPRTGTICRYFDAEMVEFFEADDEESLAAAMRNLYLDPTRRTRLAITATERFGRKYTWSEHKKVYVGLVQRLLGKGANAPGRVPV
jgi:glycosyltransferase involved in cell wall biosynthesis